jgi:hypothetical protein
MDAYSLGWYMNGMPLQECQPMPVLPVVMEVKLLPPTPLLAQGSQKPALPVVHFATAVPRTVAYCLAPALTIGLICKLVQHTRNGLAVRAVWGVRLEVLAGVGCALWQRKAAAMNVGRQDSLKRCLGSIHSHAARCHAQPRWLLV